MEAQSLAELEGAIDSPELAWYLKNWERGMKDMKPMPEKFGPYDLTVPKGTLTQQARDAAVARALGMKEGSTGIPLLSKKQGIRSLILPLLAAGGAPITGGASIPLAALSSPKVAVNTQEMIDMLMNLAGSGIDVSQYALPYGIAGDVSRATYNTAMEQ